MIAPTLRSVALFPQLVEISRDYHKPRIAHMLIDDAAVMACNSVVSNAETSPD